KKNLFQQYITANDNGFVICPDFDDTKVKYKLQQEFAEYARQAKQGSLQANYLVSVGYLNGMGVNKDIGKGFKLLKETADKNYVPAKILYISMILFQKKIIKNYITEYPDKDQTLKWIQNQANHGNLNAQFLLATIYLEVNRLSEAHNLIEPLAKKGYAMFQYLMGYLYYYGFGVEIDYSKASYWYLLALKHDPPLIASTMMAGDLYELYTKAGYVNPKLALFWYKKLEEDSKIKHCKV
ncbi:MAG: sel1 repeat family protein, partial [Proteobacteria bacterium]|nr:sel1 repeat family protein [Pseudomonadota bacterium]